MTDVRAIERLNARELSTTKSHVETVTLMPSAETCAPPMYRNILIATDGSALSEKAVTTGLALAKGFRAKATVVTVSAAWAAARTCHGSVAVPFDAYERAAGEAASKILASVGEVAKQLDAECVTVHVKGNTAEGILEFAKNGGCDLIVMASHGRHGLSRLFLGSQATRVLTSSTVPVLICK
jgi:nucleotide-binding universal stress UspA family protein